MVVHQNPIIFVRFTWSFHILCHKFYCTIYTVLYILYYILYGPMGFMVEHIALRGEVIGGGSKYLDSYVFLY
jgi:hypothetical protein